MICRDTAFFRTSCFLPTTLSCCCTASMMPVSCKKGADAFHGGFAVGEHLLGRQIVFQYLALFVQRDGAVFQCVEHGAHAGVLGTFADDGVEYAVGFVQHLYHAVRGNRMQYAMQSQFLCPLHGVTAANEHLHPLVPHLVTAFFDIVGVVDLMDGEAHPEVWGHRDHLGDMGRKGNHADVRVVLLCLVRNSMASQHVMGVCSVVRGEKPFLSCSTRCRG